MVKRKTTKAYCDMRGRLHHCLWQAVQADLIQFLEEQLDGEPAMRRLAEKLVNIHDDSIDVRERLIELLQEAQPSEDKFVPEDWLGAAYRFACDVCGTSQSPEFGVSDSVIAAEILGRPLETNEKNSLANHMLDKGFKMVQPAGSEYIIYYGRKED